MFKKKYQKTPLCIYEDGKILVCMFKNLNKRPYFSLNGLKYTISGRIKGVKRTREIKRSVGNLKQQSNTQVLQTKYKEIQTK